MWYLFFVCLLKFTVPYDGYSYYTIHQQVDTVLLFKKDTLYSVSNQTLIIPFIVSAQELNNDDGTKQQLILENPSSTAVPEGVYELYIIKKPVTTLQAHHPGFVDLIDLYSLTAPNANQRIIIDISKAMKYLKQKNGRVKGNIIIRFQGIALSDGSKASTKNRLTFTGVSIRQIK